MPLQAIIEDENSDASKVSRGIERVFRAGESLDDILVAQKGVERTADVGIIFDNNNALIAEYGEASSERTSGRGDDKS